MEMAVLQALAKRMRSAIECLPPSELPFAMTGFPAGACGDASLLLGAYLVDSGFSGFEYVCGERGSVVDNTWTSHAWLQSGELTVDITADQFEDAPGKVIVAAPSQWHEQFEVESTGPSDFRVWTGTSELGLLYSSLRPLLFD